MLELGLKGKVAIVTGGSEGLGRATADRVAREGVRVAICARRKDVLEQTAEAIRRATGGEVFAQPADVTRRGGGVRARGGRPVRRGGHPRQQRGDLRRGGVR